MSEVKYHSALIPNFIDITSVLPKNCKRYKIFYNDRVILIKEETLKNIFNECYKFLEFPGLGNIKNFNDYITPCKDNDKNLEKDGYYLIDNFIFIVKDIADRFKCYNDIKINEIREYIGMKTSLVILCNNLHNFKNNLKRKNNKNIKEIINKELTKEEITQKLIDAIITRDYYTFKSLVNDENKNYKYKDNSLLFYALYEQITFHKEKNNDHEGLSKIILHLLSIKADLLDNNNTNKSFVFLILNSNLSFNLKCKILDAIRENYPNSYMTLFKQ